MATRTSSGLGSKLLLAIVVILGVGWFFGQNRDPDDGVGIFPPVSDDAWSVVLVVHWSHTVEREVTTTYWIDGQRYAGMQEESMRGEWREFFLAEQGTQVELLAENVGAGGRLSCFIFSGPPGNEILVRELHRIGDAGDCRLEYTVGGPPNVSSIE